MANETTNNNQNGNMEEEDFATMFEQSLMTHDLKEGAMVTGSVLEIIKDQVLVDIGYKSEGFIDIDEFRSPDGEVKVEPGQEVDVVLEEIEDENGNIVLSKEKADRQKVWKEICDVCEREELIEGTIVARIKGGLAVDIGVKAFLPGSQVDLRPVRNLDKLIGEKFKFKVIKFNEKRGNIVLSRRALLEKEREEMKSKTLEKLEEGLVVTGIVKNITNYGAFVDLGGIDGLLHITDMSWGRVNHPSEVFAIGDEVKVKVLKFDEEKERVSLGIKQMFPDPWENAEEKYPVEIKTKGKVVSLTDYGAFVELEEGIEGLIHISEMSWTKRIKHPSKLVSVGDEVDVVILDIDVSNRRISLGMKQVEPNPWEQLLEKYPKGTVIRGKIRNITDFGLFIGIEEGIDGLVHVSDISWTQKVKHPVELYEKGEEIEAVVLSIDPEKERFSLGIKQLRPDPWKRIPEKYFSGMVISGKVSKVTDFGAFVEIEDGVEGLVHVSELANERIENPSSVVTEGEEIKAEIKNVDPVDRRIALSVRSLMNNQEKLEMSEFMSANQMDSTTNLGAAIKEKLGLKEEEKPEETVAEKAPVEEVKAEEATAEEAKPEETVAEEAPAEEAKDEEAKTEEPPAEEASGDDATNEEKKTEE